MKIPIGTDEDAIKPTIAVMFTLWEYRVCFKEWQQKNLTTIVE